MGMHPSPEQTRAAERFLLFDHGDLQAELRRADGRDVATRAGADDVVISLGPIGLAEFPPQNVIASAMKEKRTRWRRRTAQPLPVGRRIVRARGQSAAQAVARTHSGAPSTIL